MKGNELHALMLGALLCGCTKCAEPGRSVNAPTGQDSPAATESAPRFRSVVVGEAPPKPTAEVPPADDFEGTVGIIEAEHDEQVSTLQNVRFGKHPLYDRAVFEFEQSLPGYKVEYIDKPVRQCGSGNVVAMPGDAWLEIRFFPAAAHTEEGKPTLKAQKLEASLPNLLELQQTCDFEAVVTWVLAVNSPEHYRVLELANPPRLVLDVHHSRR